ncbi:MAG: peptidoglycan-binding protein, partial [Cyanobacteria bacterium REEB65]|nr:peptidoglycan-binding protein [Cyanobacteria bacterium REEB65]
PTAVRTKAVQQAHEAYWTARQAGQAPAAARLGASKAAQLAGVTDPEALGAIASTVHLTAPALDPAKNVPLPKASLGAPALPPLRLAGSLAAAGVVSRIGQEALAAAGPPISQPKGVARASRQFATTAQRLGLAPDAANLRAFVAEAAGYANGAVGPDSNDHRTIADLQQALANLGYSDVKVSGTFDAATAQAIVDFKVAHGLHQTYKIVGGQWAINAYVGQTTAEAMAGALSVPSPDPSRAL